MNILFYTIDPNPPRWVEALQRHLPEARIAVFPHGRETQADYAVCWKPPADFFDGHNGIKAVFNVAAGVDHILAHPGMQKAAMQSVPIVRLGDAGMAEQMEEYVLAAALRWHRKLAAYREQQQAGVWKMLEPKKRDRVTVGVLGLGVLGVHVTQSMRRFGYQATGWSRSAKRIDGIDCHHGVAGLPAFLARTNVLVCLLPLTDETRGILDRTNLAQLPQGAHVINIGRGAHLVEADLLALLDAGHLGGATLDVFPEEPLAPASPLWSHPKVFITPHVSASTLREESMAQIAGKIRAHQRGAPLTDLVDRAKGY